MPITLATTCTCSSSCLSWPITRPTERSYRRKRRKEEGAGTDKERGKGGREASSLLREGEVQAEGEGVGGDRDAVLREQGEVWALLPEGLQEKSHGGLVVTSCYMQSVRHPSWERTEAAKLLHSKSPKSAKSPEKSPKSKSSQKSSKVLKVSKSAGPVN